MSTPTLSELQKAAADKICKRFPQITAKEFRGDITLTIAPEILEQAMNYAKNSCGFDMLVCVSSVDHLGEEPRFEVNYKIGRASCRERVSVRV